MNEDKLKEAFEKIKNDIFSLGKEMSELRFEIIELKTEMKLISEFMNDIKTKKIELPSEVPAHNPTHAPKNLLHLSTPTDNPTLPHEIKGLIAPNSTVSIGNRGVPTDRPTDRQTDQHIIQHKFIDDKISADNLNHLERASEILASLDNLKKEVRIKFKKLTQQEMQVFSFLYSLEEAQETVDYKTLSSRLNLSESSIRDYINKIQKKGIPITKEKLNNKRIILHISPDLKKVASLNTILQLREL